MPISSEFTSITTHPSYCSTDHLAKSESSKFTHQLDQFSPKSNLGAYERVYSQISQRYASFDPATETGFGGKDGVLGNIEGVSKEDLIGMMMHIRDNPYLFSECKKNSRSAPFFDKLYLMSDEQQGWNLRLHFFNAKSNGLGGEDSPHYHRWTLASEVLTGGYCNRNYKETSSHDGVDRLHVYDKYRLEPTKKQDSTDSRSAELLGKAAMMPSKAQIYDRDSLNHFPIEEPHSVQTMPSHFGSTVTLAHTSRSQKDASFTFKKPKELGGNLTALPEIRGDNDPQFADKFDKAIAHMQILKLQDDLRTFFEAKWENGKKLTRGECDHQYDSYERNYVETSLLSALQIYMMERDNGVPHREFAPDTAAMLDRELAAINPNALENLIKQNQHNLEEGVLKIEKFSNDNELMAKFNDEFITGLEKRS